MSYLAVGTAYVGNMKIFGYIAILMGKIMNFVYNALSAIGINNIGVSIIVMTILIYTLMLPLTYKQQKFSRLSKKMSPELKALQEKYKNRKDQASQQAMMEEQKEIYAKYGVSPTGSCAQAFLSILILFPLYRVIYNVPAYVTKVKETLQPAVDGIMNTDNYKSVFDGIVSNFGISLRNIGVTSTDISDLSDSDIPNRIIDILYKCSTDNWNALNEAFSGLNPSLSDIKSSFDSINNFCLLNITNSPAYTIKHAFADHNYLILFIAVLVPLLAGATQFINYKLMPQQTAGADDPMTQQMKTMNYTMPLMSVFFAFTLPFGLGIYWITGAVIRSVYQVILNRHFDNVDLDEIIEQNKVKAAKKKEKQGINIQTMNRAATMSTKNIRNSSISESQREEILMEAEKIKKDAVEGSMAKKANMVKEFNERNNR